MDFAFSYIILPLLIFFARVVDVSLGTIRIIFVSKGFKILAAVIGFVEVLIWIVAINQIWANLSNYWLYFAFAAGFSTGSYVGVWLEDKLSFGNVMLRIIIRKNADKLVRELRKNGYEMTIIKGLSGDGKDKVHMVFSVVKRKRLKEIFKIVKKNNPKAFFTVEDIRNTRRNEYHVIDHKKTFNRKGK